MTVTGPESNYKPGKKGNIVIFIFKHFGIVLMVLLVTGTYLYLYPYKNYQKNKAFAKTAVVQPVKTDAVVTEAVKEMPNTGTQYRLINLSPEKGLEDYIEQAKKDFPSFNRNSGDILFYAYKHIDQTFYLIGFISFEEKFESFDPETRPIPDAQKQIWQGKQPVFSKGTSRFKQNTDSAFFAIDKH